MTSVDAAEARWADDGGPTPSALLERPTGTIGAPVVTHTSAAGRVSGDGSTFTVRIPRPMSDRNLPELDRRRS